MFIIIGGDGKEYGPVSADQIRSWLAGGRANLDTKAKAVGTEAWQRLGDFPEFSSVGARPTMPPPTIAVIVSDPKAFAEDLKSRSTPIDISACIGRGFDLWKNNFLPLVGVTFLVLVVQTVASMIPFLGMLSSLLLNGVFLSGLYYFYIGKMRGEHRQVGDAFSGFSRVLVPAMLANLIMSAIIIGAMLVFSAPLIMFAVKIAMQGNHLESFPTFSPLAVLGFCVGGILVVYLSVSWVFTFPLIIDQGLGPWTAMEVSRRVVGRQWFRMFLLVLLGGIIAALGLLALFIGFIFTLPLMFCFVVCAYEHICRPPPRA